MIFFQCWFLWKGFLFLCTWVNWSAAMTRILGMNHSVADPRPLKLPIGHLLAPGWLWLSGYWQQGSKQFSRPGFVCDCRRWTAEWSSNWPGLLTPGRTGEVEFFQLKSGVVVSGHWLFVTFSVHSVQNMGANTKQNFTEKISAETNFLRKRYMEKRCHMIGPNH